MGKKNCNKAVTIDKTLKHSFFNSELHYLKWNRNKLRNNNFMLEPLSYLQDKKNRAFSLFLAAGVDKQSDYYPAIPEHSVHGSI